MNNNPVQFTDSSGQWLETAFDILSLAMTINDIRNEGFTVMNTISLVTDVASVILPVVPAGVSHALRAAKYANKAVNAVDTAADATKLVNKADNFWDAAKTAAKKAENVICPVMNSFEADTPVATQDGDKAIAAIEIGDYVLAWDETSGKIGYYEVTDAFHHTDQIVTELIIDGEWIETTPEHPFYVEGRGWVEADDLQIGDQVRQSDGTTGTVWLKWNVHKTQEMYNLTVDTAHTFFVGEGQWLVHNSCRPFQVGPIDKLKALSTKGDNLDLHHVPQQHPAKQIIPGYNPNKAPAIALPNRLHENIPTSRGPYWGSARDLLAKDIWDLRKVGVPNKPLQSLINLNKRTYPWAFFK